MKSYLLIFSLFISLNSFARKFHCSNDDLRVEVSTPQCEEAVRKLFRELGVESSGQLGIITPQDHDSANNLFVALERIGNPDELVPKGDVAADLAESPIEAGDDYVRACTNSNDRRRLLSIKDCLALKITDYQVKNAQYNMIGANCREELGITTPLTEGSSCSSLNEDQKRKLSSVIDVLESGERANSGLGDILAFCEYGYAVIGGEFQATIPVGTALRNPQCSCAADLRLLKRLQQSCPAEEVADASQVQEQEQEPEQVRVSEPSDAAVIASYPDQDMSEEVVNDPQPAISSSRDPNPFPGESTQAVSSTPATAELQLTSGEGPLVPPAEEEDAALTGSAVRTELAGETLLRNPNKCSFEGVPYSENQRGSIELEDGETFTLSCRKGISSGTSTCNNGTLVPAPRCNVLGQARACGGKRGTAKYECYKQNIKTAHNNVFGVWKQKVVNAKAELDFATSIAELDLEALDVKCRRIESGSQALKRKRKNFVSTFCRNGQINPRLRSRGRFNAVKRRFKRLAQRAHNKAKSKFKVEFEAYRAQTLWFSRVYISRLKREANPLGNCIGQTHVKENAQSDCFYSSLDIAECLAYGRIRTRSRRSTPGTATESPIFRYFVNGNGTELDGSSGSLMACGDPSSDASTQASRRSQGDSQRVQIRSHGGEGGTANARLR